MHQFPLTADIQKAWAQFTTVRWAAPCENVYSGIWGHQWSTQACASAQFDQGLHCPLTETLDTTECMNREQRPGWYFAHAQVYLNMRILRMFEGTFSLNLAQIVISPLQEDLHFGQLSNDNKQNECKQKILHGHVLNLYYFLGLFSRRWQISNIYIYIYIFFFSENRIWHFMQTVFIRDKSCFLGNIRKYFNMSSAENFTQSAKRCGKFIAFLGWQLLSLTGWFFLISEKGSTLKERTCSRYSEETNIASQDSNFISFRVYLFYEGTWCTESQTEIANAVSLFNPFTLSVS